MNTNTDLQPTYTYAHTYCGLGVQRWCVCVCGHIMEPVETAAADTTSNPSPLPHTQPSHPHSYTQSEEPPPKRPRLDPDPPSKPRPIGIAQPLIRQLPKATPDHSDSEESHDSGRFNRLVNESDIKVGQAPPTLRCYHGIMCIYVHACMYFIRWRQEKMRGWHKVLDRPPCYSHKVTLACIPHT